MLVYLWPLTPPLCSPVSLPTHNTSPHLPPTAADAAGAGDRRAPGGQYRRGAGGPGALGGRAEGAGRHVARRGPREEETAGQTQGAAQLSGGQAQEAEQDQEQEVSDVGVVGVGWWSLVGYSHELRRGSCEKRGKALLT